VPFYSENVALDLRRERVGVADFGTWGVGKLTSAGDDVLLSDCTVDCSDNLGVGGVGALVDLRRMCQ
jgi:hypothetical protein